MLIRKEGVFVDEKIDKMLENDLRKNHITFWWKFPEVFIMGTTKENEQVEESFFNETAPSYDQMAFE